MTIGEDEPQAFTYYSANRRYQMNNRLLAPLMRLNQPIAERKKHRGSGCEVEGHVIMEHSAWTACDSCTRPFQLNAIVGNRRVTGLRTVHCGRAYEITARYRA